ncbi:hypothetical protein E9228_000784 [Curtobacterium flaccumfaciens]|uniref:Meckel syndrome type 1 protein n=1 Tax=Curtobacterium salicis TaxID=1779862 RepID=A0ABX0T3T9_9MICO|nr:hypothetical protein [Curtobacterium sp. WW7]NII40165.1 hypothetical protein [Curtobacterium sp. WW7]
MDVRPVVAVGLESHLAPAPPALDPHAVAPDYPPAQELLPPAPTSPNVDTVPFAPLVPARPAAHAGATEGSGAASVSVRAAGRSAAGRHGATAPAAMAMPAAPVPGGPAADGGDATANWYTPQPGTPLAPEAPVPSAAPAAGSWLPTIGTPATDAGAVTPGALADGADGSAAVTPGWTAPGGPATDRSAGLRAAPGQSAPVQSAPVWSAPAPATPPAPAFPVVPAAGQPRFSVPGLEHVVVEGGEPEPVGPIGYRTPARFARQQARVVPAAVAAPPTFDALLAAPTAVAAAPPLAPVLPPVAPVLPPVTPAPSDPTNASAETATATATAADTTATGPAVVGDEVLPAAPTSARAHRNARGRGTPGRRPVRSRRPAAEPRKRRSTAVPLPAAAGVGAGAATVVTAATDGGASLPAGPAASATSAGRQLGPTPGAVLGAVAGLGTIGLAAWWFTAPTTVHAVGVVLGLLAVLVSVVTMRNPLTTWQRPVALLGAVLGTVGMVVLLWAVASALGAPLPDLTGTGTVPTIAP